MPSLPTLIVVGGPAGSGKTTLAHAIAAAGLARTPTSIAVVQMGHDR